MSSAHASETTKPTPQPKVSRYGLSWGEHLRNAAFDVFMRTVARSSRPILVGPFRSELGFEILYWLPFLHWVQERYHLDPARFVVVSRGGAGAWYPAGSRTLDLYDLLSLEECRIATHIEYGETGLLKQTRVSTFDRRIRLAVIDTIGAKPYWLHPAWMYATLAPWWTDRAGLAYVAAHTRMKPLPTIAMPASWQVPERYLAVRFYARATFPMTATTIDGVQQLVAKLATQLPIVVLNPRAHVDDHVDFRLGGDTVWQMPPVKPSENLALQSALLKRSAGFVGTYGGFAQLALRLGVPSLSLYDTWQGTAFAHKALSDVIALKTGVGFQVMQLKNLGYWRGLLT